MDALTIQRKIYEGRGKAALRIGLPCRVYRPASAEAPLTDQITILNAGFNASDSKYLKPNEYNKPVWYADLDGNQTQPGDYLVRMVDGAVWFIAAQQQLLPIIAIDCPRAVKIVRQPTAVGCGIQPYSGLAGLADVLGTNDSFWPASILIGGRTQASEGLPAGVKQAGWKILLPPSVPINIQFSDIAIDDLGRRFAVESAEKTDLGWRLIANEVHT